MFPLEPIYDQADFHQDVESLIRAPGQAMARPGRQMLKSLPEPETISELYLSPRAEARLELAGITTIPELLEWTEVDLRALPQMGELLFEEIKAAVVRHLKGLPPPDPPLPEEPTSFCPGSPEKLHVFSERADAGVALFHPEDGADFGEARLRNRKPQATKAG